MSVAIRWCYSIQCPPARRYNHPETLADYSELLTDEMSQELPNNAKPLASLLISKVYFYMNIQEEAVEFALSAGSAFQQEPEGEYRETIIAGCLDRAIQQTSAGEPIDPKLSAIVDSVLRSGSSENGKLVSGHLCGGLTYAKR